MKTTNRLSLERHAGPYDRWPPRTRLFCDGEPTRLKLSGYHLFRQFEVGDRFLLVLDYDCPFEEMFEVYLVSADHRVRSRTSDPPKLLAFLGVAMGALEVSARNLYVDHEIADDRTVRLVADRPPSLRISVRDRRPLGIGSLLDVRHEG